MRMIRPEIQGRVIMVAEHQPQYHPLEALVHHNPQYGSPDPVIPNTLVVAFRPSEEERQALAEGADVYIALLTFGGPMQPIMVAAGKEQMAGYLGLEVVP